ncbi:lipid biosynthesis B12-binding/radical SAM protein [bacterium F16]|nr:lipid biosynthesis B12-binding/radical SAM protein [bacterium F16]
MSKVFFIATNTTLEPYPVYPLGMAVVSQALLNAGHTVEQFDFLASGKSITALNERVSSFLPDFICLSMRNIDNVDSFASEWYLDNVRDIIHDIRTSCDVPVICGGPGFSIMPEKVLAYIGGNYGVQGEGEEAVIEIIDTLNRGDTPDPITYATLAPLGPDAQAAGCYIADYVDFYENASGIINLQTKRGCPFKCTYCSYPTIEGNVFRPRNPIDVVDDVERLQQEFGANDFFFTDSVFNDKDRHYVSVVEELIRRNLGIRWGSFFTPRSKDLELLPMLKESGLYAVELGTDASSDTTLRAMKKGFTFDDVIAFNQACVDNKIPVGHFIIFGGPGETMETLQEGLDNISKLAACVVFGFAGIRILPNTTLHQQAIDEGVIAADNDLLEPAYYTSPHINYDEMNTLITQTWLGNRTRVFPPSEGRQKMKIMKNFGFNGILWDGLIRFPDN